MAISFPTSPQPVSPTSRQPVSVFYSGARRFSAQTPKKLQHIALTAFNTWLPDQDHLWQVMNLPGDDAFLIQVHKRLRQKLEHEPIEDLRIDFEDGLGSATDDEEDALAAQCGRDLALVPAAHRPPFAGLRLRPLSAEHQARALRTLEIFLRAYAEAGGLFAVKVTLPKVESAAEVKKVCETLSRLEAELGLAKPCPLEIMIETAPGLMQSGRVMASAWVNAGDGRVESVHFGTYDYTSSLGIAAAHQAPDHSAAEFARQLLQVALAETGVPLSDGALHELPLPIHRPRPSEPGSEPGSEPSADLTGDLDGLTAQERAENLHAVTSGLGLHAGGIFRAMRLGIYRGWDLHPHQLLARYGATITFFRQDLEKLSQRVRDYQKTAGRGGRSGAAWEDGASARGLMNHFSRGYGCGALDEDDLKAAGLTPNDFA